MAEDSGRENESGARVIFSAAELLSVREGIRDAFAARLKLADLHVFFDGSLIGDRIHAELRLTRADRSLDLFMEAATEIDVKDAEELIEARVDVVEFLVAMLEEWFDDGAMRSPNLDWETFTYGKRTIVHRGDLSNAHVNDLADEFLRSHGLDPANLDASDAPDEAFDALLDGDGDFDDFDDDDAFNGADDDDDEEPRND